MKDRQVLEVGLSRFPYVEVKLGNDSCRALVDTGADWSMLDYTHLSEEGQGRRSLVGSDVKGQVVKGLVWCDVVLDDGVPVM